jgi:hypothetical protein
VTADEWIFISGFGDFGAESNASSVDVSSVVI